MDKTAGNELKIVYMDNSSTTKPFPEVVTAMGLALSDTFGNPSSLHRLGLESEKAITQARHSVAALIGASKNEIYFTSGGTEANNWAIFGSLRPEQSESSHIITSSVEHPSVMSAVDRLKHLGCKITIIPVSRDGKVDPAEVLSNIRENTRLVSIMLVQNEIGAIQPCEVIGRALSNLGPRRPRFHVDAVQAFARLKIDVVEWGIDLLSVSAHKIHGPKGIGALYIHQGTQLDPFIFGGGQEQGRRSGTENVPGIIGLKTACDLWSKDMEQVKKRLISLKARLIEGITAVAPDSVLHSPETNDWVPHIVHFSFPGFRGETLLHSLEKKGVFVSTGSACSSHKAQASPVILALGRSKAEALSAIRFSISRFTTENDIETTISALQESLKELSPWKQKLT